MERSKASAGSSSSVGEFAGQLDRIDVNGTTKTPDFSVDVSGQPVPLDTTFHAIVDGTNGDTYLQPVDAQFLQTKLTARGGVYGKKGVKGRTIQLDVTMDHGTLEDVLKLAVKSAKPVMTGAISLTTKLLIPPGEPKVADRLQLDGTLRDRARPVHRPRRPAEARRAEPAQSGKDATSPPRQASNRFSRR